jgi:hypothetical protein
LVIKNPRLKQKFAKPKREQRMRLASARADESVATINGESVWEKLDQEVNNARRILATCIMTNATPGQLDVQLLFEGCLGTFHQRQE